MLLFVFFKLFYRFLGSCVLLAYIVSSSAYSQVGQKSKKFLHVTQTNISAQGDPKDNKPNKSSKQEDNNTKNSPILPHNPVKVYIDAKVSKSDIIKDFKNVSIIYMWFNKITGRVYVGSAVNGSKWLATYYQPSIQQNKSLIYQSILNHGHASFSVVILENCGNTSTVSKSYILEREQYYLDWALKTYGLAVLNSLNTSGPSNGFNPISGKTKSEEILSKFKNMIFVYDVTQKYKLLGVYPTFMCARIFRLCNNTLTKLINNKEIYKSKYFFSKEPYSSKGE